MSQNRWFRIMLLAGSMAATALVCPLQAGEAAQETEAVSEPEAASEPAEDGTAKDDAGQAAGTDGLFTESTDDVIGQVLDALGQEKYRTTRELLRDGEVVENGTRGEAGSGVQQILVDFGQDITVDGIVGEKTIGALHEVQEGFGLATTDSVNLEEYDRLLPLLLISTDEESADPLLRDYYDSREGDGYYDYLKGCALYVRGRYYLAKEAFESSAYQDSASRAGACEQAFPENGEIWHNPYLPGSDTRLTVTVNSSDQDQGMCFQIFTVEGRSAAALFVRGNGSASTSLPAGTYRMRDSAGYDWYGVVDTFGPEGYYEYMVFSEDEDTQYDVYLEGGQAYELTINVSELEDGADSVSSTGEGWEGAGAFGTD